MRRHANSAGAQCWSILNADNLPKFLFQRIANTADMIKVSYVIHHPCPSGDSDEYIPPSM